MTAERRAALVESARRAFMDAMLAEPQRDPIAAALTVALEEVASPAFLRPLVEEQSAGEWYEETIDKDVAMFSAAIRALIKEESHD